MLRQAVNSVSHTIFPGVNVFENEQARAIRDQNKGNQVVSSLPLQMALYFNLYFFPAWLTISVAMLEVKYSYLTPLYRVVIVTIILAVTVIEAIRLYLGYAGNLTEMVPELAGFWLLTLLLTLPLQAFLLLNEETIILPAERATNTIMMLFILLELVFGYMAIRNVSRQLAAKFHLQTMNHDPPVNE